MTFVAVNENHAQKYNAAMAAGMAEKLFFLPMMRADVLVDFGCADGTLTNAALTQNPNIITAGYDLSAIELKSARENCPKTAFFQDLASLKSFISYQKRQGRRVCLVASSVYHEVAHYGGASEEKRFWDFLNSGLIDEFAFRDFSISREDALKDASLIGARIKRVMPEWQYQSFESVWGKMQSCQNVLHAILKSPWVSSWERENAENYFPIYQEDFLDKVRASFSIVFESAHQHAYTNDRAQKEFGIGLPCNSHLTLFAQRK